MNTSQRKEKDMKYSVQSLIWPARWLQLAAMIGFLIFLIMGAIDRARGDTDMRDVTVDGTLLSVYVWHSANPPDPDILYELQTSLDLGGTWYTVTYWGKVAKGDGVWAYLKFGYTVLPDAMWRFVEIPVGGRSSASPEWMIAGYLPFIVQGAIVAESASSPEVRSLPIWEEGMR